MRLRVFFLAATAALATTSGYAEDARLSGMGANIFGNSFFHFSEANLKAPPVTSINVGRMRVLLQQTKLSELRKVFGGTIYQQGVEHNAAYWLCYTTDGSKGQAATVWFLSNSLGGGDFVMMVAAEAASARGGSGDCSPAPAVFSVPDMGIPGIGATTADLKAHFGAATVGSHSTVSYRSDRPAKDGLGTAQNAQYIGYIVRGGVVTGVGVGETSTQ